MSKRTCEELGVCQGRGCPDCEAFECEVACSREPACPTFPFAPGVIDQGEPVSRMDKLGEVLLTLALLGAVAAVAGFASGYLDVGALLP